MKFAVLSMVLSVASAAVVDAASSKCNADNCARQATGTYDGMQSSRLADCSSFQACTVTTYAPVTNCGSAVPTQASSCNAARYASACSCAGITNSYVTVTAAMGSMATAPAGTPA